MLSSALDREAKVSKFSFLEFAITEATQSQSLLCLATDVICRTLNALILYPVAANLLKTPLITRPRTNKKNSSNSLALPQSSQPIANTVPSGSFNVGSLDLAASIRAGAGGIVVLLKVNIIDASDTKFSTTISVFVHSVSLPLPRNSNTVNLMDDSFLM